MEQVRSEFCPNCQKKTVQERPNPDNDEWRCYGCGMYLPPPASVKECYSH